MYEIVRIMTRSLDGDTHPVFVFFPLFQQNEKKSQYKDKDKENDKDNGSPHERDHKGKMSKSPAPKRMILDEVWGYAKAGETTAIMGASGAGKTSLFGVLSGRFRSKGAITVEADIRLSGQAIDPSSDAKIRSLFAFVEQEDALHTPSTPREALRFSARLRLPKSVGDAEIDSFVDRYIKELGLSSCADTMIGGGLKKGISGGEKRRTSIGVELISKPSVILLDEPTSGLDSFAAKQVMALLDKVAAGGATVLFTIHQPSSSVFGSFDRLMMLNRGRLMYEGATARTPEDFSQLGYASPNNYNPADWIVVSAACILLPFHFFYYYFLAIPLTLLLSLWSSLPLQYRHENNDRYLYCQILLLTHSSFMV